MLSLPLILQDYGERGFYAATEGIITNIISWFLGSITIPHWAVFVFLLGFCVSISLNVKNYSVLRTLSTSKTIGVYKVVDKKKAKQKEHLFGDAGDLGSNGEWVLNLSKAYGHGIYGPYIELNANKYRAIFRLKVDNNQTPDTSLVTLDITSNIGNKQIAILPLTVKNFNSSNKYQDFCLDFELKNKAENVEFRVNTFAKYGDISHTVSLESITLEVI